MGQECRTGSGVAAVSYRGLHTGATLLLLSPPLRGHKVVAGVTERLQEGVEDAEKVVGLHSSVVFTKVPHCPGKLWRNRQVKVAKTSRHHPPPWKPGPRPLESQATPLTTPPDTQATPTMVGFGLGFKTQTKSLANTEIF